MANKFCHIELSTDDTGKAVGFYKKLFKWELTAMKGMPYTMINTGSKDVGGGIQPKQMPEAPTMWMPYVEVESVKKTVAKARSLGATVYVEYMPMGGNGAIGVFSDPTGASIGVWKPPKKAPAKKPAKKKPAKK